MTKFEKDLIRLFAKKTKCSIQYGKCPCNSCFHALNDNIDWKHIVWLILLGVRGDYDGDNIIKSISNELDV